MNQPAMSNVQVRSKSPKKQEYWRQSDDVVTHNDVIDAYLKGKEVGRDEVKLAMNKLFQSNLSKARDNSEKLHEQLKKIGINISEIHLKADNLTDFVALVIAKKEDYISEDFLKAISLARGIKKYSHSEDFCINFSFTYQAKTFDENCLNADGYFLKYYADV
ncbi:MAG: hypothetical protein ACTHM7_14135 [Ginsengibacter sp.]